MSTGRAELTNVRPDFRPRREAGRKQGTCDECGAELRFHLHAGAVQPTVYEEASIVLRCSCGASSVYTVTP